MFLTGKIQLIAYNDSQQTEFPQEKVLDMAKELSANDLTNAETLVVPLVGAGSHVVNFNSISPVKRWFIYSNATEVTVALNGGSSLNLLVNEPGYMPLAITSMTLTNTDPDTDTTVTVVLFR